MKKMFGKTDEELSAAVNEGWPPLPDLPPLPSVELPPYTPRGHCAKCRFAFIETVYWRGYHGDTCPIPVRVFSSYHFYWGAQTWAEKEQLMNDRANEHRLMATVPEHQDRKCLRCSYRWAEATTE